MPVYLVEWTKTLSCYVEAASVEECDTAAEKEGDGNSRLRDYAGYDDDWDVSVLTTKMPESKADSGVFKGEMMALEDAQREWHNEKCRQVPDITCPGCSHRADGEDVSDFTVKDGEYARIWFLCPECETGLDTEAVLGGEYTEGAFTPCDKTLPLFGDK